MIDRETATELAKWIRDNEGRDAECTAEYVAGELTQGLRVEGYFYSLRELDLPENRESFINGDFDSIRARRRHDP